MVLGTRIETNVYLCPKELCQNVYVGTWNLNGEGGKTFRHFRFYNGDRMEFHVNEGDLIKVAYSKNWASNDHYKTLELPESNCVVEEVQDGWYFKVTTSSIRVHP